MVILVSTRSFGHEIISPKEFVDFFTIDNYFFVFFLLFLYFDYLFFLGFSACEGVLVTNIGKFQAILKLGPLFKPFYFIFKFVLNCIFEVASPVFQVLATPLLIDNIKLNLILHLHLECLFQHIWRLLCSLQLFLEIAYQDVFYFEGELIGNILLVHLVQAVVVGVARAGHAPLLVLDFIPLFFYSFTGERGSVVGVEVLQERRKVLEFVFIDYMERKAYKPTFRALVRIQTFDFTIYFFCF